MEETNLNTTETRLQLVTNEFLSQIQSFLLSTTTELNAKLSLNQPLLYGENGKESVTVMQISYKGDRNTTEVAALLYNLDTGVLDVISLRDERLNKEYRVYLDDHSNSQKTMLMFESADGKTTLSDDDLFDEVRALVSSELAEIEFNELQDYLDKDSAAVDWDLDALDESEFV